MNGGRDLVEDMCLLSIRHPSGNIRQSFVICRRIVHGVPCLGKQRYIRCEVKKKGAKNGYFHFVRVVMRYMHRILFKFSIRDIYR